MRINQPKLMVCLLLVAATLAVYMNVQSHEFVYDDEMYITDNPQVQMGLTRENVLWAFTTTDVANWHPLTWLSHMADCELYGLNPRGHHLTNLLFHAANAVLLFLVLHRMTAALWRSAFVAAIFALHPLHVESVAWVAERKDVLSTLFWVLTLWGYARYVEKPGRARYLLALSSFACGLMSKPMLVTLPFVLLLVDYWPLNRFSSPPSDARAGGRTAGQAARLMGLVREKLPFFALSALSSIITVFAQQHGGAMAPLDMIPLKLRMANAAVSYLRYAGKMFWPQKLAVFYPLSPALPAWQAVASAVLLVLLSTLVVRSARKHPYLPVGWFWYLGTLVPVIGLVQVGVQSMADRYTYVPLIGLAILIAWGAADLAKKWRRQQTALAVAAVVIIAACMTGTWLQVRYWENGVALFTHALQVTADNSAAHYNLAHAMADRGRLNEAIDHYSEAVRINPNYVLAHYNLGLALIRRGRLDEAVKHYAAALRIQPTDAKAHNNLGIALAIQGKTQEAVIHFLEAIRLQPNNFRAHYNLGYVLFGQRRPDEAISHYFAALRVNPDFAEAHYSLGIALAERGRISEAVTHFSEAVRLRPDYAVARDALESLTRRLEAGPNTAATR